MSYRKDKVCFLIRKNYILEGGLTQHNTNPEVIIPFSNMELDPLPTERAPYIIPTEMKVQDMITQSGVTFKSVFDVLRRIMDGNGGTTINYDVANTEITILSPVVPTPQGYTDLVRSILNPIYGLTIVPNPDNSKVLNISVDPTAAQFGYKVNDTCLIAGQNVSFQKNAAAGTITITASGGGGTPFTPTQSNIYPAVKPMIRGVGNINVTHDDTLNIINIASTGGGSFTPTQANIYPTISPMLVAGSNTTITPNAANNTITIASSGAIDPSKIFPTGVDNATTKTRELSSPDGNSTINLTVANGTTSDDSAISVTDTDIGGTGMNASSFSIEDIGGVENLEILIDKVTYTPKTGSAIAKNWADILAAGSAFAPTQQNIYPTIKPMLVAGSNVTLTANDTNSVISIAAENFTPTQANLYPSVKPIFKAGSNIVITPTDASNELEISAEQFVPTEANIYPIVKPIIVGGSGVTVTPTDANNTIAISVTPQSQSYATIKSVLKSGNGINVVADDTASTLTINYIPTWKDITSSFATRTWTKDDVGKKIRIQSINASIHYQLEVASVEDDGSMATTWYQANINSNSVVFYIVYATKLSAIADLPLANFTNTKCVSATETSGVFALNQTDGSVEIDKFEIFE